MFECGFEMKVFRTCKCSLYPGRYGFDLANTEAFPISNENVLTEHIRILRCCITLAPKQHLF